MKRQFLSATQQPPFFQLVSKSLEKNAASCYYYWKLDQMQLRVGQWTLGQQAKVESKKIIIQKMEIAHYFQTVSKKMAWVSPGINLDLKETWFKMPQNGIQHLLMHPDAGKDLDMLQTF